MSEPQAGYDVGVIHVESHDDAAADNYEGTERYDAVAALDLLPCPWCGGTTLKVFPYDDYCREYSVDCWDCDIHGPYARTEALAVERWNGRAAS